MEIQKKSWKNVEIVNFIFSTALARHMTMRQGGVKPKAQWAVSVRSSSQQEEKEEKSPNSSNLGFAVQGFA